MANEIDNAIDRIQDLAQACLSVTVKSNPNYPVDAVPALPAVITFLVGGEFTLTNATIHHNFINVMVEFHFNRSNLQEAYRLINAVAMEFPRRLAGDPTLGGKITTIRASGDNPATYTAGKAEWAQVATQMIQFNLWLKNLKAPLSTA